MNLSIEQGHIAPIMSYILGRTVFSVFQSNGFRVSVPSLHSTHQPASSLFSLLPQFARATTWLSVLRKQAMPNEICQESAKELDTRALGECGGGELYLYTVRKQENQQEAKAVRKMVIRKLPVRLLWQF